MIVIQKKVHVNQILPPCECIVFVVLMCFCFFVDDSNLVDSASSHTLVSKIKPCMSKYNEIIVKLRMAHYISYSLFESVVRYVDNRSNSRANTCIKFRLLREGMYLLDMKPNGVTCCFGES